MSWPWMVLVIVLWCAVVLLGLLYLGLLRRVTPTLERLQTMIGNSVITELNPLAAGDPVPPIQALDAMGEPVTSFGPYAQLVVLTAPGCSPCDALLDQLMNSDASEVGLPITLVTERSDRGQAAHIPNWVRVLYENDRSIHRAFRTPVTPQAFAIDDGVVRAETIPGSITDLRRLAGDIKQQLPVVGTGSNHLGPHADHQPVDRRRSPWNQASAGPISALSRSAETNS